MKIILFVVAALLLACSSNSSPPDATPPSENGAGCEAAGECASALCVAAFADGTVLPGGLCTEICEWNDDLTDTCADEEICLRYNATGEFFCFDECVDDADCRTEDGWFCAYLGSGNYACIPPL